MMPIFVVGMAVLIVVDALVFVWAYNLISVCTAETGYDFESYNESAKLAYNSCVNRLRVLI